MHRLPRLTGFHPLWRFGLAVLVLCLVGGYVVSGVYMAQHYENRDERSGFTFTDVQGAYAGVVIPSPLLESLRAGHPEDLPDADRRALIEWLESDHVRADYENFDLGDAMPADIIAISCVECHARGATGEDAAPDIPLEYPDDVFDLALSKDIRPKDMELIVQSLHAHAPSMSVIAIVIAALAACTRWPRAIVGAIVALAGVGLLADLAGQPLARAHDAAWTWAIVLGGGVSSICVGLLGAMTILDLCLPAGRKSPPGE